MRMFAVFLTYIRPQLEKFNFGRLALLLNWKRGDSDLLQGTKQIEHYIIVHFVGHWAYSASHTQGWILKFEQETFD